MKGWLVGRRFAASAALISMSLYAASGAAPVAEDIRDIRGPRYLLSDWALAALAAGAVLIALSVYGIWRWRRKRLARILSPYEIALQRLEEIGALMQPARAREFSIAVSDIVRLYIEQRFSVTATRRTTEEFLHDLLKSSDAALAQHQGLLGEFLHQCDFVKFAAQSLTRQNMESLLHSARAFVLATAEPHDPLPAT
jgi:Domain of unknown function (DUF4381)